MEVASHSLNSACQPRSSSCMKAKHKGQVSGSGGEESLREARYSRRHPSHMAWGHPPGTQTGFLLGVMSLRQTPHVRSALATSSWILR